MYIIIGPVVNSYYSGDSGSCIPFESFLDLPINATF